EPPDVPATQPAERRHMPQGHVLSLAITDMVLDHHDEQAARLQHSDAFLPYLLVLAAVLIAPLHLAGVLRMEIPAQHELVSVPLRAVLGVVMVGHAVAVGSRRDNRIKFVVLRPVHVSRVAYVDLHQALTLERPLGLDLIADDPPVPAMLTYLSNLTGASHRVQNRLCLPLIQESSEDNEKPVVILGRVCSSSHGWIRTLPRRVLTAVGRMSTALGRSV